MCLLKICLTHLVVIRCHLSTHYLRKKSTTCDLDPSPTDLVKDNIDILLQIITKMVNLSLLSGVFPEEWKLALIIPLIKKLGLDLIFKSYRPVSNLPFVSKVVERAMIPQDSDHMKNSFANQLFCLQRGSITGNSIA